MRWRKLIVGVSTLAIGFSILVTAQRELDLRREAKFDEELLYLPNEKLLNHFTGGMSSVVADMLWLKCIQYTSKHFREDRKFTWLDHMCKTITRLDPNFADVYRFGGIFLAALKADSDASIELLKQGLINNPERWDLAYEIAMVYLVNRREEPNSAERAVEYLSMAVATGKAPESVVKLAADLSQLHDVADVERAMWENMLATTDEDLMRDLAQRKLVEIDLRENCKILTRAVDMFTTRFGHSPKKPQELVDGGIVKAIPPDPLRGHYFIDPEGVVQNSTILDEKTERRLDRIRAGIESFKKRAGRWPESLEEAVSSGDLGFIPKHPYYDRDWRYDPATGEVS